MHAVAHHFNLNAVLLDRYRNPDDCANDRKGRRDSSSSSASSTAATKTIVVVADSSSGLSGDDRDVHNDDYDIDDKKRLKQRHARSRDHNSSTVTITVQPKINSPTAKGVRIAAVPHHSLAARTQARTGNSINRCQQCPAEQSLNFFVQAPWERTTLKRRWSCWIRLMIQPTWKTSMICRRQVCVPSRRLPPPLLLQLRFLQELVSVLLITAITMRMQPRPMAGIVFDCHRLQGALEKRRRERMMTMMMTMMMAISHWHDDRQSTSLHRSRLLQREPPVAANLRNENHRQSRRDACSLRNRDRWVWIRLLTWRGNCHQPLLLLIPTVGTRILAHLPLVEVHPNRAVRRPPLQSRSNIAVTKARVWEKCNDWMRQLKPSSITAIVDAIILPPLHILRVWANMMPSMVILYSPPRRDRTETSLVRNRNTITPSLLRHLRRHLLPVRAMR